MTDVTALTTSRGELTRDSRCTTLGGRERSPSGRNPRGRAKYGSTRGRAEDVLHLTRRAVGGRIPGTRDGRGRRVDIGGVDLEARPVEDPLPSPVAPACR